METSRRLLLASIIGVAGSGTATSVILGFLISLAYVHVFEVFKPYKNPEDSTVAIVFAYSLTLFFFAALMIKMQDSEEFGMQSQRDQDLFGICLIFIFFMGPTFVFVGITVTFMRWLRDRNKCHITSESEDTDTGLKKVVPLEEDTKERAPAEEVLIDLISKRKQEDVAAAEAKAVAIPLACGGTTDEAIIKNGDDDVSDIPVIELTRTPASPMTASGAPNLEANIDQRPKLPALKDAVPAANSMSSNSWMSMNSLSMDGMWTGPNDLAPSGLTSSLAPSSVTGLFGTAAPPAGDDSKRAVGTPL